MEQILKEKDIVNIFDNKFYLVVKTTEYEGRNYACICNIEDKDKEKPALLIVREDIENNELSLVILDREDEISPVLAKLQGNN